MVEGVIKDFGNIHILVNNAGITRDNLAMRMKDEEWDEVIHTNLSAVFRLSRAVLRPMMKTRWGRIINITSVVGVSGNAGQVNYAAAKAGVAGMSRSLAREVASRGITVNAIAPGFIETDINLRVRADKERFEFLSARIPAKRWGKPADLAGATLFLASPASDYVSGIILPVDGGYLAN
jgi:3-oxoacyl-[acyl-carrier protein] reductase